MPTPLLTATGLTNQITGPAMSKVADAVALHCVAGAPSPVSQTVTSKSTVPVTPGAGSIMNEPVAAFATTVPTFGTTAVIVPATGVIPSIAPTERVGVYPALPTMSAASAAPTSSPLAASKERCMFACSEPAPYARPGDVGASLTALTVIVKDCDGLVSSPPLAVPPLSDSVSVIVAAPCLFAADV